MFRAPTTLLLAGLALAAVLPANAQVNPYRSSAGAGLAASDFKMQDTAARRLLSYNNVQDGRSENWSNPRTGANGTITILNSFKKQDMLCRKVEFASQTKGRQEPRKTQIDWCQTPQGWKVVSP